MDGKSLGRKVLQVPSDMWHRSAETICLGILPPLIHSVAIFKEEDCQATWSWASKIKGPQCPPKLCLVTACFLVMSIHGWLPTQADSPEKLRLHRLSISILSVSLVWQGQTQKDYKKMANQPVRSALTAKKNGTPATSFTKGSSRWSCTPKPTLGN